jgi:hypothetical protein
MNYDNEIIIRQNYMIIKLLKILAREKATEEDKKETQEIAELVNKAVERRKEGVFKKGLL